MINPIYYYSVMTGNRGDIAIRKSTVDAISSQLDIPFAFFNVKYEELTEERIVNQLNTESSCLMIAGSGLYTNYPMSSGWYFPCKTELFSKIKVPIILVGLGCNNNIGNDMFEGKLKDQAKDSILKINKQSSWSSVRDLRTYKLLYNLGMRHHKLLLDPANFLKVNRQRKEKKVAINLAQHSPALGRFDGDDKCRKKNIYYFSGVYHYLTQKGYKAIFIAHDALEYSLIKDLKTLCPKLEYLNTDNIDTMLEEYSKCEFSIGMKMHSNIMSFASGTPFISVYYDIKSVEYAKLVGCQDFQVCVFDDYLEELKEKIDLMIKNIDTHTYKIDAVRTVNEGQFNMGIKEICNIIKTTI